MSLPPLENNIFKLTVILYLNILFFFFFLVDSISSDVTYVTSLIIILLRDLWQPSHISLIHFVSIFPRTARIIFVHHVGDLACLPGFSFFSVVSVSILCCQTNCPKNFRTLFRHSVESLSLIPSSCMIDALVRLSIRYSTSNRT